MYLLQMFTLDIIAITETSHKKDGFFTANISLKGLRNFTLPQGAALYVRKNMMHLREVILKSRMIILKVYVD